jgi:PBSX family phage terminase large subunit
MQGPLCDKQWDVIHFFNHEHPSHLILHGSVRSGKTHVNNLLWISHVYDMPKPRKDLILTGYTIGSIERNVVKPLADIIGRNITLDQFGRFDMGYHKVNCFGTNTETAYKPMQGMTAYGWYGNEVSTHHANSITEAWQRCSGDGHVVLWDSNPDHPYHPVKINNIDHSGLRNETGRLLIHAVHFQLEDNETLSAEYIATIKRTTPQGMWYDRRIKGLWVAAEGAIYESFHRDKHMCKPFKIPDDWQRIRGIDFGTIHPFVMLWGAIDPDGRLYIYREYYRTNTLIKDHAEKIKALSGKEKYLWTISDHDAQERLEYEYLDISTKRANKTVKLGLDLVAQRMVDQIDGRPRVMIFDTCTELPRQIGVYRWLPYEEGKPYKEEPLKVDDDGPDVLRYMITEIDFSSAPQIKPGFRGYRPRPRR